MANLEELKKELGVWNTTYNNNQTIKEKCVVGER